MEQQAVNLQPPPLSSGFSLVGDKNSILQLREEHGVTYRRSIPGCKLIDWLLQNGEVESRRQGVELCRALLEQGIIQHGKIPLTNQFSSSVTLKPVLLPTLPTIATHIVIVLSIPEYLVHLGCRNPQRMEQKKGSPII